MQPEKPSASHHQPTSLSRVHQERGAQGGAGWWRRCAVARDTRSSRQAGPRAAAPTIRPARSLHFPGHEVDPVPVAKTGSRADTRFRRPRRYHPAPRRRDTRYSRRPGLASVRPAMASASGPRVPGVYGRTRPPLQASIDHRHTASTASCGRAHAAPSPATASVKGRSCSASSPSSRRTAASGVPCSRLSDQATGMPARRA
jgi:hypothetical protein